MWRIKIVETGLDSRVIVQEGTNPDDDYSDVATIDSEWELDWVIGGEGIVPK